jgi:hypothetical protein
MTDRYDAGAAGAQQPSDAVVGATLLDRYRIEALLAVGGMARVYRSTDQRLDREVAVKILSPPYADDDDYVERFLREARAAASITHPSLVHVYDSGTDDDRHFIVMELLAGYRSLREVLGERGRIGASEAVAIGRELLTGLGVVHERGLVHCDVKAANVMLGPGSPKLIDFGIARSPDDAMAGRISIGSLGYMAPEQLRGESLSAASDLFSLGVVLYEAITGTLPFAGSNPEAVAAAHDAQRVRPPSTIVDGIPGRLDAAILQALRREPGSRFRSAEAMSRALLAGAESADDDETRVVAVPGSAPAAGYVPPPAPPGPEAAPRPSITFPTRPRPRQVSRVAGMVGSAIVIGAAILVVLFVMIPLLQLRGPTDGPGSGGQTVSPSASAAATPVAATVLVPDTIGMTKDEAIDAATGAGLDWTIRCAQDPQAAEGIIDQEPAAGTEVRRGTPFTMYSARVKDCR